MDGSGPSDSGGFRDWVKVSDSSVCHFVGSSREAEKGRSGSLLVLRWMVSEMAGLAFSGSPLGFSSRANMSLQREQRKAGLELVTRFSETR